MKRAILLGSIALVILVSGCIDQNGIQPTEYKNDIITIEEYYVSDTTPYLDSIITIDFLVQNNGEQPVPRVKVSFKTPGFEIEELKCSGDEAESDHCLFGKDSKFGEIDPFDVRSVSLKLSTPPEGSIVKPAKFTISYYIEYDYTGFRKMDLPIIDGDTVKTPSNKYSQSTPTYGPILLEFKAPERGESVIEGKTVKEYWGIKDSSFRVEMELTNVGSSKIRDESPIIEADHMRFDLKDALEIAYREVGNETVPLPCDFYAGEDGYLYLKDDVEVPGELKCEFKPLPFDVAEIQSTIWADFDYTYEYSVPQEIEVRPLE